MHPSNFTIKTLLLLVALLPVGQVTSAAETAPESQQVISEVMDRAMDSGLILQVIRDQATYDQILYLATLFDQLDDAVPPEGSSEHWKARTRELSKAVEEVRTNRRGARQRLQKAANCASCHTAHRTDHHRSFSTTLNQR